MEAAETRACDAFEAVIGAIFLDGGYEAAAPIALRWLQAPVDEAVQMGTSPLGRAAVYQHAENWKTALQEWLQGQGLALPVYALVNQRGPAHAPEFIVEVRATLPDESVAAEGVGASKKVAEREAARALYTRLSADDDDPER